MMSPEQDAELRAHWLSKRYRQPFAPRILFDCRFHGLPEIILGARYRAWLDIVKAADNVVAREFRGMDEQQASNHIMRTRAAMALDVEAETGDHCQPFREVRRMGIGDIIVLVGVLQSVERLLGHGNVVVCIDERYPGARDVFEMSGLATFSGSAINSEAAHLDGFATVDCRRHCMAHPLTDFAGPYYGELRGSPSDQILWNLGWENIVTHHTADVTLSARGKRLCDASEPYLVCQPMERTRGNDYATPERFRGALLRAMSDTGARRVMFGSAPGEANALREFVNKIALPFRVDCVQGSLCDWASTIAGACAMICGNTSAMWLSFGLKIPVRVITNQSSKHGSCWEPKASWFADTNTPCVML